MNEHFYVRIRGRVQGPYDVEKLRSLVRRGQLSRMHEVSNDKVAWRQAADFPDLFAAPEVRRPDAAGSGAGSAAAAVVVEEDEQYAIPDDKDWYYAKNNVQNGPVTFDHLKALVQAGAVLGGDLVWKQGMGEWKPAWQVQGLQTIPLLTSPDVRNSRASDAIDAEIVRTMADAKGWAGFVSVCINGFGLLMLGVSLMNFLFGVRKGNIAATAGGLFGLLWGSIILTAGVMLAKYNGNVGRFLTDRSPGSLDAAMRNLKSLWVFASIVLLLFLINTLGIAIWVFSAGLVSLE